MKQLLTFGIVGSIGTACHYAVLVILVELAAAHPVVSSSLGFAIGAIVNYGLNYRYTFRSSQPHSRAFSRFAAVACCGALLNALLVYGLVGPLGIHYLLAQFIATAAVVLVNFLLSKFWAFDDRQPA